MPLRFAVKFITYEGDDEKKERFSKGKRQEIK
jgi:hypothetical protein